MTNQNSGPLTDIDGMVAGDVSDLSKATPIGWPTAQRICDIPAVHEALDAFSHDSTEDNAVGLICAVLNAAGTFAQGRAAGLEEIIDMLDKFGTLKYRAGCTTHKTSLQLLEQAHAYRHMIHEAIAALSPTPSDAGKDDAAIAQDEQDRETGRKWREDSSLETWFPFTAKELVSTRRLFADACADLGYINEELGLDPDDGGAEPILDVIRELKTDAARYRWLRDKAMFGTRHDPAVLKDGPSDCCEFAFGEELDALVDAALSSLEVIGKGEKG